MGKGECIVKKWMKIAMMMVMAVATLLVNTGCQALVGGGIGIAGAALMDRPIKKAVKRLGEDQGGMRADISTLDQNVSGLNRRVTTLEDGQAKQDKTIGQVSTKVSAIEQEMLAEAAAKRATKAAEDKRLAEAKAKARADALRKQEIELAVKKALEAEKAQSCKRIYSNKPQPKKFFNEDENDEDFVVGKVHRPARTCTPNRHYEDPDYGKTVIRMRAGRAADIVASGDVVEDSDAAEVEIKLKYNNQ